MKPSATLLACVAILACARAAAPPALGAAEDRGVVDLHVDLPYALHARRTPLDEAQASPRRLAAGGVRTIVTPLFVQGAWAMPPAAVRVAYQETYADLRRATERLHAGVLLSFEGADGFADDPAALDAWMARGACLVGLVHDRANALGGASQDPDPAGRARGLSEAGRALAARVVARGALLDVAHASDATFDDLATIARAAGAPLVDSHTGARALRDTPRNLDDARLRAIAQTGGVVGISLHGGHVGAVPGEPPTIADVAAHVVHAVEIAGASHVVLGSDLDGGSDPPAAADGEAVWPLLERELSSRGVPATSVEAIFGGNARRVLAWARAHGCTPGAR